MLVFIIFALVIAIIAAIFTIQNVGVVPVTFLLWHINSSLALVLLIALAAGVLICLLACLPGFIRGKLATSAQRKKLAALEDERNSLKQKADEAEKAEKVLEEQVASLSAELEKCQASVATAQPTTTAPAATTQAAPATQASAQSPSPEAGYPVNHTR